MSSDYFLEVPSQTGVLEDLQRADKLSSPENPESKLGMVPLNIRVQYLLRMSRREFHDEVLKTIKWFFPFYPFKGKEVAFRLQYGSLRGRTTVSMLDENLRLRTSHSLIHFARRGVLARAEGNKPRYVLVD